MADNQVLTAANFSSEKKESDVLEKEEEPDVELGNKKEGNEPGRIPVDMNAPREPPDGLVATLVDEEPGMMTLWDPHNSIYRQMEANCTICFSDYEVGDTLIRSAADDENEHCYHVFHYECMLAWLEKGTKTVSRTSYGHY